MKKLYLLFVLLFPIGAGAQTIYVDAGNNSGTEDGTAAHPFNTIEEGLDATTSGQTVFIQNGEYSPSGEILYLKPDVTLEGESKENVIINADLKDTTNSSLPVKIENLTFGQFLFIRPVLIDGVITEPGIINNCICKDIYIWHKGGQTSHGELGFIPYFHITNNEVGSISYGHEAGVIVGENIISGNMAIGVAVAHEKTELTQTEPIPEYSYLIENNTLSGSIGFGQAEGEDIVIMVRNNKAKALSNSSGSGFTYTITGNTFQSGYIDSSGANKTVFSNNTIVNGGISDASDGLDDGSEDAIIENNIIHYEYDGGSNSAKSVINVSATSISIKNNIITGKGRISGIVLSSGPPTNIIGNTISLDTDSIQEDPTCAIFTISGEGVVTGNKIYGAYYGYFSASGAKIFANNEIDHVHHGFFSVGLEEVANNTIKNCTGHGLILAGMKGPVHDNIIVNNDSAGIYMMYNLNPESKIIERNIIKNNGWYDLVIAQNSNEKDTVFARNNVWDHQTLGDILQYDILNFYPENIVVEADSFIIPPDAPNLSLPENASVETDTSLNLSWQESTGAEIYKLQISETPDFNTIFLEQDSISTLNFTVGNLDYNTTYYWHCLATNLAGESDWSETWQFQTKIATRVTEMQSPALLKVYPNPTSGKITLEYSLKRKLLSPLKFST